MTNRFQKKKKKIFSEGPTDFRNIEFDFETCILKNIFLRDSLASNDGFCRIFGSDFFLLDSNNIFGKRVASPIEYFI